MFEIKPVRGVTILTMLQIKPIELTFTISFHSIFPKTSALTFTNLFNNVRGFLGRKTDRRLRVVQESVVWFFVEVGPSRQDCDESYQLNEGRHDCDLGDGARIEPLLYEPNGSFYTQPE